MKSSVVFSSQLSSMHRSTSHVLFNRRRACLLLLCLTFSAAVLWLGVSRARMANLQKNIPTGSQPSGVAVNTVTNKIYVTNTFSNNVTVVNGVDHSTATVAVGIFPSAIAVNPVTNKIYVANQGRVNQGGASVTVIDGAENSTVTVASRLIDTFLTWPTSTPAMRT